MLRTLCLNLDESYRTAICWLDDVLAILGASVKAKQMLGEEDDGQLRGTL